MDYETAIFLVIGWVIPVISGYVLFKTGCLNAKIQEIVYESVSEVAENEDLQKKVYVIGALLGNGIKHGIGMNVKGGKFKISDIVSEGVGAFMRHIFSKVTPSEGEQEPPKDGLPDIKKILGMP